MIIKYVSIASLIFMVTDFLLGQVHSKFDTIYCVGFSLQEIASKSRQIKFDNYNEESYKFQFKIDRIDLPDDVELYMLDSYTHYGPDIETCFGPSVPGGTIESNTACSSFFGLYTVGSSHFDHLPWIFSGEVYTFPGCDSLLTKVIFKIDTPKNHDSGVPKNAVWTYQPSVSTGAANLWQVYVTGDTLIGSMPFSMIAIDKGNGPVKESAIPVMVNDKVWYFYENGKVKPFFGKSLYDAQTKRLTYYLPSVFHHYDITNNQNNIQPDSAQYTSRFEKVRNVYFLSDGQPYYDMNFEPETNHRHYWKGLIEDVASQNGFFGAFRDMEPNEENGMLVSYQNHQFTFHYTDSQCGFISNAQELFMDDDIILFPNPAIQHVSIHHAHEMERIYLYDMFGKCVGQFKPNQPSYDISMLQSGMYIFTIEMKNKKRIHKRLVVSDSGEK